MSGWAGAPATLAARDAAAADLVRRTAALTARMLAAAEASEGFAAAVIESGVPHDQVHRIFGQLAGVIVAAGGRGAGDVAAVADMARRFVGIVAAEAVPPEVQAALRAKGLWEAANAMAADVMWPRAVPLITLALQLAAEGGR